MNYFELFGISPAPSVDRSLLSKKYFELQRLSHPDFHTQSTEAEQEEALSLSANINKAYGIFQDKERTIEYFLQEKGLIVADEKYSLPADFLMEMMEINEAITEDDKTTAIKQVSAYENGLYEEIKPVIENYDPATSGQPGLLKLKDYYYKKKYLNRILDRLAD